jgi:hypothetical protein
MSGAGVGGLLPKASVGALNGEKAEASNLKSSGKLAFRLTGCRTFEILMLYLIVTRFRCRLFYGGYYAKPFFGNCGCITGRSFDQHKSGEGCDFDRRPNLRSLRFSNFYDGGQSTYCLFLAGNIYSWRWR